MQNEMLMDDSPRSQEEKNLDNWESSGDDKNSTDKTPATEIRDNRKPRPGSQQKQTNKNSAAKAISHARSAVGNTNPNIRTGLSDDLNITGTNVAYTERED